MKPFRQYLTENHRTFEFRVRIAGEVTDAMVDKMKIVLEMYKVDSITKAKRLPIQESPQFPNMGPVEINVIDVVLHYPCNDEQVRLRICEGCGVQQACVKVTPLHSPYEAALEGKEQSNQGDPEQAVLLQDDMKAAPADKDLVGDARIPSLIKELEETRKYQYSEATGGKTKTAKTTNELPMGNLSPVGSHQNKIPVAKKMPAGNGR